GIRDRNVTGVQTCALPIFGSGSGGGGGGGGHGDGGGGGNAELLLEFLHEVGKLQNGHGLNGGNDLFAIHDDTSMLFLKIECWSRSEERRVGKAGDATWWR